VKVGPLQNNESLIDKDAVYTLYLNKDVGSNFSIDVRIFLLVENVRI